MNMIQNQITNWLSTAQRCAIRKCSGTKQHLRRDPRRRSLAFITYIKTTSAQSSWRNISFLDVRPVTESAFRFLTSSSSKSENGSQIDDFKNSTTKITSDPPVLTWVDQFLPPAVQPYARLARIDKPIGTWLLLWPCLWSTALAAPSGSLPDSVLLGLFATGAFVMRGAGCTINDMWDRRYDAQVSRTASRPLVNGDVSLPQAWAFLAAQLSTGLAVLVSLPHTWYCFQWGAASLPLVAAYPATKRFFPYPQFVLGLTFNWGAWMGWAAVHGSMDYTIIAPLYGSGVAWTLVYDTIYAHQDKLDDAKLSLQSTALTFGEDQKQRTILYSLATTSWLQWLCVGYAADLATIYTVGATTAYAHLLWQVRTVDFDDPHSCMARFRSNSTVGAIMFCSFAAGSYFA